MKKEYNKVKKPINLTLSKDTGNIDITSTPKLMIHIPNPDLRLNKANLILYLEDFKKSVESEKKDKWQLSFLELAFVFSFFFTSSFKDLGYIKSYYILYIYIALAAIYFILKIQRSFKKDESKNKQPDPEEMANIIESKCLEK